MNQLHVLLSLLTLSLTACTQPAPTQTFTAVAQGDKGANLVVEPLRAGPVTMKFANGELRYLQVGGGDGNVELVRRVYFAVRDQRFDTPAPKFDKITVVRHADSFTAELSARVTSQAVDFTWTGTIEGNSDGTITYTVSGKALKDFASPRIGLNVLLPVATHRDAALWTTMLDGEKKMERFPVQPEQWNPPHFTKLMTMRIPKTAGSQPSSQRSGEELLEVLRNSHPVSATLSGREFGIEDQRQFGDSSYKAYGYLDLPFPKVTKDAQASQTLTLQFVGAKPATELPEVVHVRLGRVLEQRGSEDAAGGTATTLPAGVPTIPQIKLSHEAAKTGDFNAARNPKNKDATSLTWGFNPCLHLNDPDTLFENAPTIVDQISAVHVAAPQAKLHIDPITFQWPHPRPASDPRAKSIIGAAWSVEMVRQLAMAGAESATFRLADEPWEDSPAGDALKQLAQLEGRTLIETTVDVSGHKPLSVLAVRNNATVRTLFVISHANARLKVRLSDVAAKQAVVAPIALGKHTWVTSKDVSTSDIGAIEAKGKDVDVIVGPYSVVAFTVAEAEK